jgi:hypothetical protein
VLVIGQDPAANECIVRRVLVGAAGQRAQGFLQKLGITRRYVIINALLYCIYNQPRAERHRDKPAIIAYRNRWLDALMSPGKIQAVVALGGLADRAWNAWKSTPAGAAAPAVAYAHVKHPTWPESSAAENPTRLAAATRQLLANWNAAIEALRPALTHRDLTATPIPYAETWQPHDIAPIPEADIPPGLPGWMRDPIPWAVRTGETPAMKRATICVTVPPDSLP